MIERDQFGPFLRRERERRGISLQDIATQTKISVSLFAALERNDFTRWPGGIFRRSFLRAYAQVVGLDPDRTVREFVRLFPADEEARERPDTSASSCPAEGQRRLHLVTSKPAASAGPTTSGHSRLAMAAVETVLVCSIGTAIGMGVDWFYAWPVYGLGAVAIAAANLGFRRTAARPEMLPRAAAKTKAIQSRHIIKRGTAARPEAGRTHHPRRSDRTRPRA